MSNYKTPKWIRFIGTSSNGETKKWEVRAKEDEIIVGYITWSKWWGNYTFSVHDEYITLEKTCLRDIVNFIEEQNNLQKGSLEMIKKALGAILIILGFVGMWMMFYIPHYMQASVTNVWWGFPFYFTGAMMCLALFVEGIYLLLWPK